MLTISLMACWPSVLETIVYSDPVDEFSIVPYSK